MQNEVPHHEKVECWQRGEDLFDKAVKSGLAGFIAEVPFGSPRSREWLNSPELRHRNDFDVDRHRQFGFCWPPEQILCNSESESFDQ
jgi:hypothetical protein